MTISAAVASPRVGRAPALGRGVSGARLVLQAHSPGQKPGGRPLPAVAVLGRSNVGKSSLLNALLGTRVARVSQTPGRTQALFWYRIDDALDLVDCPGYGYAKVSRDQRLKLQALIEGLVSDVDGGPAGALLLVDSRLAPQESDRSMALFLRENGVRTLVAATKWDAVKPSERVRRLRTLSDEYQDETRPLLPVSAETGENLHELGAMILGLSGPVLPPRSAKESFHAP